MFMNVKQSSQPAWINKVKLPKTTDRQATVARMFHTAQAKSKQQFNMLIHLLSLKEQPI